MRNISMLGEKQQKNFNLISLLNYTFRTESQTCVKTIENQLIEPVKFVLIFAL